MPNTCHLMNQFVWINDCLVFWFREKPEYSQVEPHHSGPMAGSNWHRFWITEVQDLTPGPSHLPMLYWCMWHVSVWVWQICPPSTSSPPLHEILFLAVVFTFSLNTQNWRNYTHLEICNSVSKSRCHVPDHETVILSPNLRFAVRNRRWLASCGKHKLTVFFELDSALPKHPPEGCNFGNVKPGIWHGGFFGTEGFSAYQQYNS